MKKIVSVKFEDGTEMVVPDLNVLVRYINAYETQTNLRKLAADKSIDWPALSLAADERQVTKLTKRKTKKETNTRSAQAPRKAVTKDDLLKYKAAFDSKWPDKTRGWITAACLEFRITKNTLKKRLGE